MSKLKISTPIVGVGVMVIDCENRVLLGHRIKTGETPTWCFAGGKIEAHESLAVSASRELFEETNLKIDHSQLKPFVVMLNHENPRVNITTGLFVQFTSDDIKQHLKVTEPHIFESWKWFSLDELPVNLFAETEVMLQFWKKQKINPNFSVYPITL